MRVVVPDVYVGRGDVDPELDAKGPAERDLSLELPLRKDGDGVPNELGQLVSRGHGVILGSRGARARSR